MDKLINFFLLLRPNHFAIYAVDENQKILINEELHFNDKNFLLNPNKINKFLDENIFKIEKQFDLYIENINLIIDHKNFITISLSSIKNFEFLTNRADISLNDLSNIKDSVLKNNTNYELIHMIINRFIINKKDYVTELNENDQKNIFLEIGMICLKKNTINSYRQILSKYQISIKNIFCFDYVNSFKTIEMNNISVIAYKLMNGLNSNEITFSKKPPKRIGFFEKFFKLFS